MNEWYIIFPAAVLLWATLTKAALTSVYTVLILRRQRAQALAQKDEIAKRLEEAFGRNEGGE